MTGNGHTIIVANWTVVGTLILAAFLIAGSYWNMRFGKHKFPFQFKGCMGKPKWDFTSNWATTLTAVGAFLSTVVAAEGLSYINPILD